MKILFVRSNNKGSNPISTRQGASLLEMDIEVIYFDVIGKGFFGYLKNLIPLRKTIRKETPEVIHAHYALSGILTSLTLSKTPIVVSLMGSDVLKANEFLLFLVRIFSKNFWNHTIVKSQGIFDRLSIKEAAIIPNGVDIKIFKPIDKNSAQELLGWNKNLKHIVFASSPKRPEKNFNLAEEALKKLKGKNMEIELHYLENLSLKQMVLHYNASDLLLLTSFYEGSPNVIKEAMACNCPIVATNVGDILENTKGTRNVFVTTFNSDEIAESVVKILNSSDRSNGRENVQSLDSKVIAQKIINIYKDVLSKNKNGRIKNF